MIDHLGPLPVADDRWPCLAIADASMLKLGVESNSPGSLISFSTVKERG